MDVQEKRFYDRANILPATDTRQHAIGLDYRDRDWLATLAIRNLSDDTVEDFNGFPKPGRTWSLSITRSL
jgi:iron complex outermembrane receptor protein